MATPVSNLTLTRSDIEVGFAATFRARIDNNFRSYQDELQAKINNEVKPAITELQYKVGEWNTTNHGTITSFIDNWPNNKTLTDIIGLWDASTYGNMTTRLGGKRVLVGSGTDTRTSAKVGDLICEVGTPSS